MFAWFLLLTKSINEQITLLGTNYPLKKRKKTNLKMIFPFPKVGYVNNPAGYTGYTMLDYERLK